MTGEEGQKTGEEGQKGYLLPTGLMHPLTRCMWRCGQATCFSEQVPCGKCRRCW